MKQIYVYIHASLVKTLLIALVLLAGFSSYSQVVPELVFKNSTRTGTAGAVGTVYKFANVAAGTDALVKISDRSSSRVTLSSIDLTTTGFDNAFQPQVSYDDGEAPKNTTWWMEFSISFVSHADNSDLVTVSSFNITALDMDGDDKKLREQLTFYGLNSYTLESPTSIGVTNVTNGKIFSGSTDDYENINTSATNLMVTTKYVNTNTFKIRVGGTTGTSASDKAERMSSLWFKSFSYSNPINVSLPIDLMSFRASKDDKGVILNWATSMEKDFSHFIIQRSTDGSSFSDIATVFSDGNNSSYTKSYAYTDKTGTESPVVYYRLKMVDIDAKFKYSEVRTIRNAKDQDQASVVVYPNPAVSNIRVTVPASWQNKPVTYSIYSISGTIVKQKVISQASQTETLTLDGMKPGSYIVRAATADQSTVKQFSKQN